MGMFMRKPYWRRPQPSTGDEILRQCNGVNSGASITVYRSTQSDAPGTVTNPCTRQSFQQKLPFPEDLEKFCVTGDKELLREKGKGKGEGLLVIMKRGRAAKIGEQDRPPLEGDIRQWAYGMTWAEIRCQCFDFLMDDDEYDDFRTQEDEEVEVDNYKEFDDYEWDHVD